MKTNRLILTLLAGGIAAIFLAGCFSGEDFPTAPQVIEEGCGWVDAAHLRAVCDSLSVPDECEQIYGTVTYEYDGPVTVSPGVQRWDGRRFPFYRLVQDVEADTLFSGSALRISFSFKTRSGTFPNGQGRKLALYTEYRSGSGRARLVDTDIRSR